MVIKARIDGESVEFNDMNALIVHIQGNEIKSLYLRGNNIGPAGAAALADVLKTNSSITSLSLRNNNIGPEGTAVLIESIRNSNIIEVVGIEHHELNSILEANRQRLERELVEFNKLPLLVMRVLKEKEKELYSNELSSSPAPKLILSHLGYTKKETSITAPAVLRFSADKRREQEDTTSTTQSHARLEFPLPPKRQKI